MSFDLYIASREEPSGADIRAFAAGEGSIAALGDLGGGRNILLQVQEPGGSSPLLTVDGPEPTSSGDFPTRLLTVSPTARWVLFLSVPAVAPPEAVALGRRLAEHIARQRDGLVYDPQEDEVTWPPQSSTPSRPRERRIPIVRMQWFMPLSRFSLDAVRELLRSLKDVLPQAAPSDPERLKRAVGTATSSDEWSDWEWRGRRPVYEGSISVNRNDRGNTPAWMVSLEVDADQIESDPWLRERTVELFAHVARRLRAFYAAAYVNRNHILDSGRLYSDSQTEPLDIPVWHGLPTFPTWLAWFGSGYRDAVVGALPGAQIETHCEGVVFRASEKPRPTNELESRFPVLPARLLQRRTVAHEKGMRYDGTLYDGERVTEEPAEDIPRLE